MVAGAGETPAGVGRNMLLDINRAEISRLKSLTGIGEHYARKIVEGRPYHHREELLTKRFCRNTSTAESWIDWWQTSLRM
jgi:DNA uptake protein ComE-like DNA-binding protein